MLDVPQSSPEGEVPGLHGVEDEGGVDPSRIGEGEACVALQLGQGEYRLQIGHQRLQQVDQNVLSVLQLRRLEVRV